MAPAAKAAWQDDRFLLKATAGRAHPPSNAFLNSMTGSGNMLAAATHWLVACLAHRLEKTAPGATDCFVSIRLVIYIFLPSMILDAGADTLSLPFYPLPSAVAKFLWRLVKVGMPSDKVEDEREARTLVGEYAAKLTPDKRTFDASGFVQIKAAADNFIISITPAMPRSMSASNQQLADLLCLLQNSFTNAEADSAAFTSFCTMLVPTGVPVGTAMPLLAVRACSHIRSTTPDAPLDGFVPHNAILFEITRRHEPNEAGRFRPLFDVQYRKHYSVAVQAFPQAVDAVAIRHRLTALALALRMALDFTQVGVTALCAIIQPQLSSLEVDAPHATSTDEERFAALVRLHKDQPGGRPTVSLAPDAAGRAVEGEDMKLLLAQTSYMSLYQEVLSMNTTSTSMVMVVLAVAKHEHPAGLVIMTTKRTLQQPAWQHVLGFRQANSWQAAFDLVLAVDTSKISKPHWGKMLPVGKDEAPTSAIMLLKHKLDEIPDWHALCMRYIQLNEGKHVLADARYAESDGDKFWLNPDILRLDEEPLHIIFAMIGHGQSRSVQGSFRHFLFHQTARAERIRRLPRNIVAFPSLVRKMLAALRDTLVGATERHASMTVRPFHLMRRTLFVEKGSAAEKALDSIDKQLTELKEQLERAETGEADYQAPHLQPLFGTPVVDTTVTGTALGTSADTILSFPPLSATAVESAMQLQVKQQQQQLKQLQQQLQKQGATPETSGSLRFPQGVFAGWGDSACRYGVSQAPEGIVFGNKLVQLKRPALNVPANSCLAAAAAGSQTKSRSQWCIRPLHCANYASHDRVDGTTNDDYVVTDVDLTTVDKSKWRVLIAPNLALERAPNPSWPISTGPGTTASLGGGGKGKSGKGKGKSGKDNLSGKKRSQSGFEGLSTGYKSSHLVASVEESETVVSYAPISDGAPPIHTHNRPSLTSKKHGQRSIRATANTLTHVQITKGSILTSTPAPRRHLQGLAGQNPEDLAGREQGYCCDLHTAS